MSYFVAYDPADFNMTIFGIGTSERGARDDAKNYLDAGCEKNLETVRASEALYRQIAEHGGDPSTRWGIVFGSQGHVGSLDSERES